MCLTLHNLAMYAMAACLNLVPDAEPATDSTIKLDYTMIPVELDRKWLADRHIRVLVVICKRIDGQFAIAFGYTPVAFVPVLVSAG